ncbi:hypothetical protein C8J56DRAFT_508138 [Mycena floridula]|nr:hypothetical protein C8J56DRAFT_508138 [Mycena floridula]
MDSSTTKPHSNYIRWIVIGVVIVCAVGVIVLSLWLLRFIVCRRNEAKGRAHREKTGKYRRRESFRCRGSVPNTYDTFPSMLQPPPYSSHHDLERNVAQQPPFQLSKPPVSAKAKERRRHKDYGQGPKVVAANQRSSLHRDDVSLLSLQFGRIFMFNQSFTPPRPGNYYAVRLL